MSEFDYKKLADPGYFKENRLDAHAAFIPFATEDETKRGVSSLRVSLDGYWKFHYSENFASTNLDFVKEDFCVDGWETIAVPSTMQLEGYDRPQYVNTQYPWDGREEVDHHSMPEHFNPVGEYVRYITLNGVSDRDIHINFTAAESAMALWVNGKYIGYASDSFNPSEFDITGAVHEGVNKIAVLVSKWTNASFFEDQDFFRFSGITRSVYVDVLPHTRVDDFTVTTPLADDFKSADVNVVFKTSGKGSAEIVLCHAGDLIAKKKVNLGENVSAEIHVDAPLLWSAEKPELYDLLIRVENENGEITEVIPKKIGIRRFEIKNKTMLINGKRIVFNGVNRHDFSSINGRSVTRDEIEKDVITMKKNNINAIRTSHYSDTEYLYDLCDIYGLYMIAESNLETHGTWDTVMQGRRDKDYILPSDHEEYAPMLLDRIDSTYNREKNHPAVIIWSIGNESFGGKVPQMMTDRFHELDKTRPVHYESIFNDRRYPDTSDIESRMYPYVKDLDDYLKQFPDKPMLLCEYTHSMGNSNGAMYKYTEYVRKNPLFQGGFIWDYIDQTIAKKDRYGREYQGYGGDFDDRPNDGNFSGNGIATGNDREAYPKMQEVKFCYQGIHIFFDEAYKMRVRNDYLFTDTEDFDCEITYTRNGVSLESFNKKVSVKPESEGVFDVPKCSFAFDDGAEYDIIVRFLLAKDTLFAKAGHEVAHGAAAIKQAASYKALVHTCDGLDRYRAMEGATWKTGELRPYSGSLKVIHGDKNIGIKGDDFEAIFSTASNGLISYRTGGRELLKKMPMPTLWRAPVDNDVACGMPITYGKWKLASEYAHSKWGQEFGLEKIGEKVKISFVYELGEPSLGKVDVAYIVAPCGTIEVNMHYDIPEGAGDAPEFGMQFKMDADYDRVTFFGDGPDECYEDRRSGAVPGEYHFNVNDNLTPYLRPQECGLRTNVRYARVTDKKGHGFVFASPVQKAVCQAGAEDAVREPRFMALSVLPNTAAELENAGHPNELPSPCYTVVKPLLMQMGIAGDDTWGAKVHPEFRLPEKGSLDFTFYMKGI